MMTDDLFTVEYKDGERADFLGFGEFSVFATRAEAEYALEKSETWPDRPALAVVRYVRANDAD